MPTIADLQNRLGLVLYDLQRRGPRIYQTVCRNNKDYIRKELGFPQHYCSKTSYYILCVMVCEMRKMLTEKPFDNIFNKTYSVNE